MTDMVRCQCVDWENVRCAEPSTHWVYDPPFPVCLTHARGYAGSWPISEEEMRELIVAEVIGS